MNQTGLVVETSSARQEAALGAGRRREMDSQLRGQRFAALAVGVAAGLMTAAGLAADPGLPFTETFDDATLSDTPQTTADWGTTTAGMLTMPAAPALTSPPAGPDSEGEAFGGDPQITRSLAVGDMNGDGHVDIVEGAYGTDGVYLNDGTGHFPERLPVSTDTNNTRGVAVADMDGDGDLDIVAGNLGGELRLYLNSGDGATFVGMDITTEKRETDGIALADFNGDGHIDVAVANHANWQSFVYLNTGDPAAPFGPSGVAGLAVTHSGPVYDAQNVLAGDLDNDGDPDLAYMNQNQQNGYCINDGSATFACHNLGAEADNTQTGALGDFNGDGFLDVLAGNFTEGQTSKVYLNTGNTLDPFGGVTAVEATSPNDPNFVHGATVGDVDNDGDLDIVLATAGMDDPSPTTRFANRVLLNDGTGLNWTMISIGGAAGVEAVTNSVAVADVNEDGKLDLLAGNEGRDADNIAIPFENDLYINTAEAGSGDAVLQLRAKAQSIRVDAASSDITSVALTTEPTSFGLHNRADFWVSSNGGANWLRIEPNGQPLLFPEGMQGQDLRWRVDLFSLSPAADVGAAGLAIDTLTLTSDAPVFTSAPVTAATADTLYQYDISATDPNGDDLTFAAPTVPAWLTLTDNGDDTATLMGTPTVDDAGEVTVEIEASDGTNTTTQAFTVTVGDGNNPPSFTSTAPTSAAVGEELQYDVVASDPDEGDTVTLTAPTLPAWLALTDNGDGTATLAGTPAEGDVGDVQVELQVADGDGASATQDFTIAVVAPSGGGENSEPSFTSTPVTEATEGTAYSYDVTATDPDSGDTLTITGATLPAWLALTDNGDGSATLTGTPAAGDVGDATVELQVEDAGGATAMQSFAVTVAAAPSDGGDGGSESPPPQSDSGGGGGSAGFGELAALLLLAGLGRRRLRIPGPRRGRDS